MRIHAKGRASRDFTPDQVIARVNFTMLKPSYQQALEEGSQMLANYIAAISERTDFNAEDFKTSSYNSTTPKTIPRIFHKSVAQIVAFPTALSLRNLPHLLLTTTANVSLNYFYAPPLRQMRHASTSTFV